MDVLVIGGGVFGTTIASELSEHGNNVTLVEKEASLMTAASRVNHNRVHFGYHYPRSPDTARQCLDSIPSFLMHYGDAVVSSFPNYYAISKEGSFITPEQFINFCRDVRIDFREEYPSDTLLNKEMLSASFRVREPIFSTTRLTELVRLRLSSAGVNVLTSTQVTSAKKNSRGGYFVVINGRRHTFDKVVNATYAGLNVVNKIFNVRPRELRFEKTVVPVFKFPHTRVGLTVMDGPFCTIMPNGNASEEFLLWHVDGCVLSNATAVENLRDDMTDDKDIALRIFNMSSSFMPFMNDVEYHSLMKTTKAVYENKYDARVSEVHTYDDSPDYVSVLSGKIMCAPQISYQVRELLKGEKYHRSILV